MFDLINCIKQVYPLENRFNFGKFNKILIILFLLCFQDKKLMKNLKNLHFQNKKIVKTYELF